MYVKTVIYALIFFFVASPLYAAEKDFTPRSSVLEAQLKRKTGSRKKYEPYLRVLGTKEVNNRPYAVLELQAESSFSNFLVEDFFKIMRVSVSDAAEKEISNWPDGKSPQTTIESTITGKVISDTTIAHVHKGKYLVPLALGKTADDIAKVKLNVAILGVSSLGGNMQNVGMKLSSGRSRKLPEATMTQLDTDAKTAQIVIDTKREQVTGIMGYQYVCADATCARKIPKSLLPTRLTSTVQEDGKTLVDAAFEAEELSGIAVGRSKVKLKRGNYIIYLNAPEKSDK